MNIPALTTHIADIVRDTVRDDGLAALDDRRLWAAVEKAIADESTAHRNAHEELKEAARQVCENVIDFNRLLDRGASGVERLLAPFANLDLMPDAKLTAARMEARDRAADEVRA